jgi:hypothetical protein
VFSINIPIPTKNNLKRGVRALQILFVFVLFVLLSYGTQLLIQSIPDPAVLREFVLSGPQFLGYLQLR